MEACRGGRVETARILLDHGANVHYQNGVSPLTLVNFNVHDWLCCNALQFGESVIWCASSAGETECVKVLVKYGAQVDLPVRYSLVL